MLLLTSVAKVLKTCNMRTLQTFVSLPVLSCQRRLCEELENITSKRNITIEDWKALRSDFDVPLNSFASTCASKLQENLQHSRSLLSFLESENALNIFMKCQFLLTLKHNHKDCTPQDHEFIDSTILEAIETVCVLEDQDICLGIMAGLSLTPLWKKYGLKMLRAIRSNKVWEMICTTITEIAFRHEDIDFVFELWDEADSQKRRLRSEMIKCVLTNIYQCHNYKTQEELIMRLIQFMCNYHVIPNMKSSVLLAKWFQNGSENWLAQFTTVDTSGKCAFCKQHLRMQLVTNNDLSTLRTELLENLVRQDSLAISPLELCAFEEFLEQAGPYTLIVDARTIFVKKHKSFMVKYLVHSLESCGEKVLVLGSKEQLSAIQQCDNLTYKNCFITNYPWKHDALIIYATMMAEGVYFISNNRFRGHRKSLSGSARDLFDKWLRQKQVEVDFTSHSVIFPAYDVENQTSEDGRTIHIIVNKKNTSSYSVPLRPQAWLCLQNIGRKLKKSVVDKYPLEVSLTKSQFEAIWSGVVQKSVTSEPRQYFLVNHPGRRRVRRVKC